MDASLTFSLQNARFVGIWSSHKSPEMTFVPIQAWLGYSKDALALSQFSGAISINWTFQKTALPSLASGRRNSPVTGWDLTWSGTFAILTNEEIHSLWMGVSGKAVAAIGPKTQLWCTTENLLSHIEDDLRTCCHHEGMIVKYCSITNWIRTSRTHTTKRPSN